MKKAIGGKIYDTGKAKFISEYKSGEGSTAICEKLYRKRTGEFFLYCTGGADSIYGVKGRGFTRLAGETLIPVLAGEANQWSIEKLGTPLPAYEEGTTILSVVIPVYLMQHLKDLAEKEGINLSEYVRKVLEEK